MAPMRDARRSFGATLMADGKVLVCGGVGAGGKRLKSVECYDPAANEWSALADLARARGEFGCARLPADGRICVVGGSGDSVAASEIGGDGAVGRHLPGVLQRKVKTGEETYRLSAPPKPGDKKRREIEVKTPNGELVTAFRSSGLDTGEMYDAATDSWVSSARACPLPCP
jgi:hypothetical protein